MTRFFLFLFTVVISFTGFAQSLNDYSYVVVPNRFEIQSESDQYKLNEMAQYYFEKYGFNVFMGDETPNAPRCDGLYAEIEEKRLLMGTGVEIVLRDCNKEEIFRSEQTRSKHKEFRKAYQDKLRKAFKEIEALNVKQKEITYYSEPAMVEDAKQELTQQTQVSDKNELEGEATKGQLSQTLPVATYTTYIAEGNSFLLQKTGEGYVLYSANNSGEDGLQRIGKIVVMDSEVKFIDMDGNVERAVFTADGTLTIASDTSQTVYEMSDN